MPPQSGTHHDEQSQPFCQRHDVEKLAGAVATLLSLLLFGFHLDGWIPSPYVAMAPLWLFFLLWGVGAVIGVMVWRRLDDATSELLRPSLLQLLHRVPFVLLLLAASLTLPLALSGRHGATLATWIFLCTFGLVRCAEPLHTVLCHAAKKEEEAGAEASDVQIASTMRDAAVALLFSLAIASESVVVGLRLGGIVLQSTDWDLLLIPLSVATTSAFLLIVYHAVILVRVHMSRRVTHDTMLDWRLRTTATTLRYLPLIVFSTLLQLQLTHRITTYVSVILLPLDILAIVAIFAASVHSADANALWCAFLLPSHPTQPTSTESSPTTPLLLSNSDSSQSQPLFPHKHKPSTLPITTNSSLKSIESPD